MYPKEYFLERFQHDTEEALLHRYVTGDLTDPAKAAILELLAARGVGDDELPERLHAAKKAAHRSTRGTMACDACGTYEGGAPIIDGEQRFCSVACLRKARLGEIAEDLNEADVLEHAKSILQGPCPECNRQGSPVEVRRYSRVWSAIYFTRRSKFTHVCCPACGRKANIFSILFSLIFGWWGIPWGILFTPAFVISNLDEMFKHRNGSQPSNALIEHARLALAAKRQRGNQDPVTPTFKLGPSRLG